MSFLTPLAFLGGLIAIPIILLYMLRLRRREMLVSSTFLWQQILRDQEANTPWQRLRRNLLLLLQLLILTLLILALARPFVTVPVVSTGQTAILLDASASMSATDIDGETRFAQAQRHALELVAMMGPGDSITVIRVGAVPEVLTPYTSDRETLRTAINNARPGLVVSDWVAALTLAAAGGAGAEEFSIVPITDGGLGDTRGVDALPGEVRPILIGQSSSNVAITALATRALPGQEPQLFAQITNFGDQDAEVVFSLTVDGQPFASVERHSVPAHSDHPIISRALPEGFTTIGASLQLSVTSAVREDYLSADNEAWAVSGGASSRLVLLMTPGNLFLEQALRSLPVLQAFQGNPERGLPAQPFDLYVFDSWLPDELPDGDLLIINPPSSTSLFTVGLTSSQATNPITRRDDPRMSFVDFDTVNVLRFKTVAADWADTLVQVDGGPLLLAGEIDGRQVAILTFALQESDLPLQITWPVLMANLTEWFSPRNIISTSTSLQVGDSLLVRPSFEADTVRVTLPDGTQRNFPVERDALVFAETAMPGIYTLAVLQDGDVVQAQPFVVNLFAPEESDITPRDTLILGQTTVVQTEREELGLREYWPPVALLALLILLIEWYAYHRRLRVPTVMAPATRRRARDAG